MPSEITPDLDVELQQLREVAAAYDVARTTLLVAADRMRGARTEAERDLIRDEIRGFVRRLSLGTLAIVFPADPEGSVTP